ncbi:hypothetical protein [Streptomyces caeruleatus]|uniref:Uncharacterized protein n=1 Tax=Streptomyces caeruleatus TaxID=661399 RepID=A0A101U110_9ACTN|nr:hypothetical protein [Streptomyces caeruleatus]KUO02071.1 hypothetical protein AQJ67_23095 [Streptomyces caeruleatus]
MARINDVGGTQGFGAIDTAGDTDPFLADREAANPARSSPSSARDAQRADRHGGGGKAPGHFRRGLASMSGTS